jgi:1-acyl-sn-glycerol-3-phosphate acyltransferase
MAYITAMCFALPIALLPPHLLLRFGFISKIRKEQLSLRAGQFCARWMLRLIPFCKVHAIPHFEDNPQPSIWVCNHESALDIFILLALDLKLRGKRRRPMKIVYVSTTLLFIRIGYVSSSLMMICSHHHHTHAYTY